jgi:hypothetical protein
MRPVDDNSSSAAPQDDEALRQRVGYLEALVQQLRAFRQFVGAIVDHSSYTATDKLVALKLRLCSDDRTLGGAYPTILARGRMHPGWTSPEGWMVKPLSDINAEAMQKKQVTAARIERTKSSSAPPRGKSRRAELDEA